ncbi:MAG: class I SAM-dependent methyltransferase, partial [Desulfovibrio sp.]|nr:class I SAM-dependent methyltransferase [Desulfovibrio sp.]
MGQKSPLNPDDIFIRRIQNNLLHHSLAGWRRRGKMLLDINCGGGRFLRSLWHSGFDVTATEENFKYRQHAAHIMKGVAEIYAAHPTHLPFEDDFFDWAV